MEWNNFKYEWNTPISNEAEKVELAKEVANKVKNGDVIGFGSGSTSYLSVCVNYYTTILSRMM